MHAVPLGPHPAQLDALDDHGHRARPVVQAPELVPHFPLRGKMSVLASAMRGVRLRVRPDLGVKVAVRRRICNLEGRKKSLPAILKTTQSIQQADGPKQPRRTLTCDLYPPSLIRSRKPSGGTHSSM